MTNDQAHETYIANIDNRKFTAAVGRFQEGFLADGVYTDAEKAFECAVHTAAKFLPFFECTK